MKLNYLIVLAATGIMASSCATQTASRGASSDDIYYSAGDPTYTEESIKTETTTTTSANYSTYPGNSGSTDYSYSEPQKDAGYRMGGNDLSTSDQYYDDEGNTYIVNNYYDDYDYDDYYYTASLYRYYSPYYGFGYNSHCYSPYYYDPFWGPSYGWNVGYSWGWGGVYYGSYYPYYPYNYGYCYSPYGYYGYYDPWYNPYYGYGGYYNGYNNGYYNGYWNGYYDGYYGSGYYGGGYYGDYYGNNDDYYYGVNTGTGSNTNTGDPSANILTAGYDKAQNGSTDMNHVLTDKGALVVDKADVNMTAAGNANDHNVAGVVETPSIKDNILSDHTAVAAINEPVALNSASTAITEGTTRNDAGVRVIKYYSADAQNVSTQTSRPEPVVSDRGPRGDYGVSNNKPSVDVNRPANNTVKSNTSETRPTYQQIPSREPINKSNTDRPEQPSYDRPSQTKPSYEQPKQPKQPTYEQPRNNTPSRSNDAPSKPSKSYETPKSNSGNNSSRPSYNSGSSSKPSGSGNSGSRPSNSGSNNRRSGGN